MDSGLNPIIYFYKFVRDNKSFVELWKRIDNSNDLPEVQISKSNK